MKEKQRQLGTELRLNASNESGGKGEISISSILLTTAVSLKVYKFFQSTDLSTHNNFTPYL